MTPERWQQVKTILQQAMDLLPEQRDIFLAQTCENDSLRKEVEILLGYETQAEKFLQKSALEDYSNENKDLANALNNQESRIDINMASQLIGKILDEKYRIEEKLGQGGMGAVYKATHLGIERSVAVKIITPQLMAKPEFVERFQIEAKAAGKLKHPNIVNVTDFGFAKIDTDKVAYLVMELLDGISLSDMLKSKRQLPIDFVVDIVEQMSLAINVAHKQGIMHRDLKPDNIWLEPNGRGGYNVKILDFGLAKLRNVDNLEQNPSLLEKTFVKTSFPLSSSLTEVSNLSASMLASVNTSNLQSITSETVTPMMNFTGNENRALRANGSTTCGEIDIKTIPSWLTRMGVIMGTPLYMSPEQCQGGEFTAQSDIYSLGVITYEMLTGETPFTGDIYQLIEKHRSEVPPSIKQIRKELPKGVELLLLTTLSKNPSERPKNALLFAKLLRLHTNSLETLLEEANKFYNKNYFNLIASVSLASLPFCGIYTVSFLIYLFMQYRIIATISWINPIMDFLYNPLTMFLLFLVWGRTIFATSLSVTEKVTSNSANPINATQTAIKVLESVSKIIHADIASIKFAFLSLRKSSRSNPIGQKTSISGSINVARVLLSQKLGAKTLDDSKAAVKVIMPFVKAIEMRQFFAWIEIILVGFFYYVIFLPITAVSLQGLEIAISPKIVGSFTAFSIFVYGLFTYYFISRHTKFSIALSSLFLLSQEDSTQILTNAAENKLLPRKYAIAYIPYLTDFWFSLKDFCSVMKEMKLVILLVITGKLLFANVNFYIQTSNLANLMYGTAQIQYTFIPNVKQLFLEAVYMGKVDTAKWLLEKPFNILPDSKDKNALLVAAKTGNVEMVRLLAKARRSALLNLVVDDEENTTLMYLAKHPQVNNRDVVFKELVANGANVNLKNKSGKTVLDILKETKQTNLLEK